MHVSVVGWLGSTGQRLSHNEAGCAEYNKYIIGDIIHVWDVGYVAELHLKLFRGLKYS